MVRRRLSFQLGLMTVRTGVGVGRVRKGGLERTIWHDLGCESDGVKGVSDEISSGELAGGEHVLNAAHGLGDFERGWG